MLALVGRRESSQQESRGKSEWPRVGGFGSNSLKTARKAAAVKWTYEVAGLLESVSDVEEKEDFLLSLSLSFIATPPNEICASFLNLPSSFHLKPYR